MIDNHRMNKILWLNTAAISLIVALIGIVNTGIYDSVVSSKIMPGVLSQDIFTVILSAVVLLVGISIKEDDTKKQVLMVGIMGYLFYGYGIYSIEQIYTVLYLFYLAVFGISAYSIVYFVYSLKWSRIEDVTTPGSIRLISLLFLIITPLIFIPLWISQLVPLMASGEKLEFLYSIYILDLSFIMPAFLIIATKLYKKDDLGYLLTPSIFIVGLMVLAPLSFGELLRPLIYGQSMDMAMFGLFLVFSLIYLGLTILNLSKMELDIGTEVSNEDDLRRSVDSRSHGI